MSASIARIEPISTQAPAREEPVQAPLSTSLRPGHRITVNGVLAAARSVGRSREHTGELCFEPLSDFVRQLVDWSGNDSWTGTFRFLIVEFVIDAGPLYAQLWSEPGQAVLMEVGPGERDEPALQAIGLRMKGALTGRGFVIGGNGRNYRKWLVAPESPDVAPIVHEMLALLTDLLGYDGTADLNYRFCQASHLRLENVRDSLTLKTLQRTLLEWGIPYLPLTEADDELNASFGGFGIQFLLFEPRSDRKGEYEELHGMSTVRMNDAKAREIVARVNGSRFLFKASLVRPTEDRPAGVSFALPLSFKGGVTMASVQWRLTDWISSMRKLCA